MCEAMCGIMGEFEKIVQWHRKQHTGKSNLTLLDLSRVPYVFYGVKYTDLYPVNTNDAAVTGSEADAGDAAVTGSEADAGADGDAAKEVSTKAANQLTVQVSTSQTVYTLFPNGANSPRRWMQTHLESFNPTCMSD